MYNDKTTLNEEVRKNRKIMDQSLSIKNIETLAVEIFKIKNSISNAIASDLFLVEMRNHYNLR